MARDLVERRVRFGVELVDKLTGGTPVGFTRVNADDSQAHPFSTAPALWVFERLSSDPTEISIRSDHYLPEAFVVDLPLPMSSDVPRMQTVPLSPRTGYPFPATLTRVVGVVRIDRGPDGIHPAAGASVEVRPQHQAVGGGVPHSGSPLVTRSADDGQYTMWFQSDGTVPDTHASLPFRCDIEVTADVGGVPTTRLLSAVPLLAHRTRPAPSLIIV
ncbi:MAG: hypothetical protein AAGF12_09380 [Myxococcota bacterium]